MSVENWSDDVLLVSLPAEPEISDELGAVVEMVRDKRQCDLVIDFSGVHLITSATIAELLKLRELLIESGRRLVLCSVSMLIKGVFTVAALTQLSQFSIKIGVIDSAKAVSFHHKTGHLAVGCISSAVVVWAN